MLDHVLNWAGYATAAITVAGIVWIVGSILAARWVGGRRRRIHRIRVEIDGRVVEAADVEALSAADVERVASQAVRRYEESADQSAKFPAIAR